MQTRAGVNLPRNGNANGRWTYQRDQSHWAELLSESRVTERDSSALRTKVRSGNTTRQNSWRGACWQS